MKRHQRALEILLILIAPALLALTAARIVTVGAWFFDFEYYRAGFPPDSYSFTQDQRREYAPYALEYIRDNLDIAYLSERALPGGLPMFTSRELAHLRDVQIVTQAAFVVHGALLLAAIGAAAYLARQPATRPALRRAASGGGALTLALVGALAVIGLLGWDRFFDAFHALFFETGTWTFHYSDTLIRLYPPQFWFDAALAVGGMTAAGAAALAALGHFTKK
ncbi:MAG: DUF1461 domain-containing protein [Anaerolineae bacterium]|nr:DUF1461 domain-containing protein [Anaerolineae bacterium]